MPKRPQPNPSPVSRIARAQPWLGTQVSIQIDGLAEKAAHAAIDAGFAAVAGVHRLMSFHESGSDVTRLNRFAATKAVTVDAQTYEVIARASEIARASDGVFDITVGKRLVMWGLLPAPDSGAPRSKASWRDIELQPRSRIRFRRPLWIDLGGIAKGYAVDQAIVAMALPPDIQTCVNAGGDLVVQGPRPERVLLRLPWARGDLPAVEIENGALASSTGRDHRTKYRGKTVGPHVDGISGRSVGTTSFVSVVAADCMTADALTKVALAKGKKADNVLRHFGATAYYFTPRGGWLELGSESAL